jgi:PAS domain S-box-containing protein
MGSKYVYDFPFLNKAYVESDGKLRKVSSSFCEYLGYKENELLLTTLGEISHPDDIAQAMEILSDPNEERTELVHRFIHKKGDTLWANLKAGPVAGESGDPEFFAIFVTDITPYINSQRQLEQQVQLTQQFLDAIDQGYLLINRKGKIVDVNPAYCEIMEYSRDELLTRTITELRPDITQEEEEDFIAKIIEKGNLAFQTQHETSGGEIKDLEARTTAFELNGSTMIAGFVRDVTRERLAQKELTESEQRWHRLVEHNPLPVLISIDGVIRFVNKAGLQMYSVEDEDKVLGKSVFDFMDPESIEKIEERIEKIQQEEMLPPSEQRLVDADGKELFVEVHSIPIKYKGKEAVQTVLRDITEAKKREEKITEALEEKEVLLQEIHHRVKNNLAVISGLLELQAMTHQDDTVLKIIRESQLRVKSMAMIHEKLYESPSLSDIGFDNYVKELVDAIIDSYQLDQAITVNYDLEEIKLDISSAIPCALILNELVSNCYKHAFEGMDKGRIEISINKTDPEIRISVSDNGRGIPDDFSLEDHDTLGMRLIETLSAQLDGQLTFGSTKGTTFTLIFPYED